MGETKEVAKILGNLVYEVEHCDYRDPIVGQEVKRATLQICQLFPPYQDALWSDEEGQCFWCNKLTYWLDICYEGYVCSAKCQQEIAQDVKSKSKEGRLLVGEGIPSIYEIQRSWTGLSWEACERLHSYIYRICEEKCKVCEYDPQAAEFGWFLEHGWIPPEEAKKKE